MIQNKIVLRVFMIKSLLNLYLLFILSSKYYQVFIDFFYIYDKILMEAPDSCDHIFIEFDQIFFFFMLMSLRPVPVRRWTSLGYQDLKQMFCKICCKGKRFFPDLVFFFFFWKKKDKKWPTCCQHSLFRARLYKKKWKLNFFSNTKQTMKNV